ASKHSDDTIISIRNVSKTFPGVKALDNVSFSVRKQEVFAILGENGAGKSTLMKILSGLYQPDSGEIYVNRQWFGAGGEDKLAPYVISDPRSAMKLGIGMVYQHFQLVEPFTVVDNITLGKEITAGLVFLNDNEAIHEIRRISNEFGLPIDPTAIIEDLPVGLKQRVEIIKQLYRDADLLILDEPTAVLTPKEAEELFTTIRKLKEGGKSIIFITHKLREPLAVADRIIALRRGKYVGEILPKDATLPILAEMVVGRKVIQQYDRIESTENTPVLTLEGVNVKDMLKDKWIVTDASFEVRTGEIVGIAGVQGNGQSELIETIMGLRKAESGTIKFQNNEIVQELTQLSTLEILTLGIGYIPEDRTTQGLILQFALTENVWLGFHGYEEDRLERVKEDQKIELEEKEIPNEPIGRFRHYLSVAIDRVSLPFQFINTLTQSIISKLDIRTSSENTFAKNLSGGNQQKVVIGREFAKDPALIIAAEPTRGVDIGVMTEVHKELISRRNDNKAILLVSSDLDEILNLADKIIVMYEGEIVGYGNLADFTTEEISELMTAGKGKEVIA
ncbi:MAG: ABC transporter ATP-binding protein, partial [Candidatus Kariarchaeaceae archaeon]